MEIDNTVQEVLKEQKLQLNELKHKNLYELYKKNPNHELYIHF
jgi:hypothetical protein